VNVLVYVEGPSDKLALPALLKTIIEAGAQKKVGIQFISTGGKDLLLHNVARKAADHLSENPADWVFALPDLYPMEHYRGTSNQHQSLSDLRNVLYGNFKGCADKLKLSAKVRAQFKVHCLKHDLEANCWQRLRRFKGDSKRVIGSRVDGRFQWRTRTIASRPSESSRPCSADISNESTRRRSMRLGYSNGPHLTKY
jgi:hypothetical protein